VATDNLLRDEDRAADADGRVSRSGWRAQVAKFSLVGVFVLGILVFLPALLSPFLLDDYLHLAMVGGTFPVHRGPLDLYDFVSDADRAQLLSRGILPWWTHPQLTIRFFRPLSSALLWANHRLFGTHAALLHLHSFLWWAAAVLAARALFKRSFSPRVTLLATAIFALAPCHAIPIAWLANYEALVSLALGSIALASYVRWRQERTARSGVVTVLFFAIALSGGEYGVCFTGYAIAIEIFLRRESIARRVVGALPFVVPLATYLLVRSAGHYGTVGSGFYTDPLRDPAAFARSAPVRFLALLADGWLTADAETFGPSASAWVIVVVALGVVALLIVPVRRVLSQLDEETRRAASWLLLGSMLALFPVLAVTPSPRVLGISALGTSVVVALVIDHAWFHRSGPGESQRPEGSTEATHARRRGIVELTGLVALLLGFFHLVHGPITAWLVGREMRRTAIEFRDHARWLQARFPEPERANVVVLRGWGGMFFAPFVLDDQGQTPARWRILSQTGHVLVLRRDARTLELIVPVDKSLTSTGSGNLFRNERDALRVGDRISVPGLQATVLALGDGGPRHVRYVFDQDLEAGDVTWIAEGLDGFHEAVPPRPGFGMPLEP
jgi:hypothetical protein